MSPLVSARHVAAEALVEGLAAATDLPAIERELRVEWSTRMTSAAGYAYVRRGNRPHARLKFSAVILPYIPAAEVRQVALHELAHLIAYHRHRHAGHGSPWKRIMRDLGCDPARTHDYHAIPAVIRAAGFPCIHCDRCGMVTGIGKRAAAKYGRRPYLHKRCRGTLRLLTDAERERWLAENH